MLLKEIMVISRTSDLNHLCWNKEVVCWSGELKWEMKRLGGGKPILLLISVILQLSFQKVAT